MPALILLSYVSLLVLSLLDNIRGPFYPEVLHTFTMTGTWGSWFFAMTSLFAFIGSTTTHRLLNYWSCFTVLWVASATLGIGFALMALSPSFLILLPCCALFGWAYGALNVAQNVMVYECSPHELRRRFFSGLHSMYGLAALAAPLTATGFRALGYDWRQVFLILAFFPIVLALISYFILKAPPVSTVKPEKLTYLRKDWQRTGLFILMMAGYLWGELSVSTRLVLWLRQDLELTASQADLYLAGFFFTLSSGRLFFSFVHFRGFSNWTILYSSAFLGAVFYYLGLNVHPLWLVVSGWLMAPFFPVAMEQISASFGDKSSQALSLIIGFGSGSVVLMHVTLGWVSDQVGITKALHLGPLTLMIIALSIFFVHGRTRPAHG